MERQRHIWQRLRQGFPRQRNILRSRAAGFWASFRKVRNITLLKIFYGAQIIQVYALQQAMEQLAGRRKDLAAVHYEKVLELYEMQTGRRISLPYHMEARRDYEGVRLCRYGEEKSAG